MIVSVDWNTYKQTHYLCGNAVELFFAKCNNVYNIKDERQSFTYEWLYEQFHQNQNRSGILRVVFMNNFLQTEQNTAGIKK